MAMGESEHMVCSKILRVCLDSMGFESGAGTYLCLDLWYDRAVWCGGVRWCAPAAYYVMAMSCIDPVIVITHSYQQKLLNMGIKAN